MNIPSLRFPIKTKLTVATLIPLAVAMVFCWNAGVFILNAKVAGQAQEQVQNDLNVARAAYRNEIFRIHDVVKFTSLYGGTAEKIASGDREALAQAMAPVAASEHLDLMTAVDASGKVIFRANRPELYGDDRGANQFVSRALKGEIATGTTIVPATELVQEGDALVRQAASVPPLPRDPGSFRIGKGAALVLMAAAPVRDRAGNVMGAICGGVLLNNNHPLADRIRGIVYEGGKSGKESGHAVLFLRDQRIAGALPDSGNTLSEEVYRRVILSGERWVGRVKFANRRYLTACDPLLSLNGIPIGALYVTVKESRYSAAKIDMAVLLSGVLLVSGLIGFSLSRYLGDRLAHPIKELELLARRVAAGEREVRSTIDSRDEIGDLAGKFNEMSRSLREREDRIVELNRSLEQKVRKRTAELEEKNTLLVQTREELVKAEKLAAVGELAAGVAHEINNPMAIIRGNTELLQISIPQDAENREEVETIFQQVKRVERIVSNLLKFARREQRELGPVRLNDLLQEIVGQIGHQEPLTGITVLEEYAPCGALVEGDGDQLRQVFVNLMLNAVQAMPRGGLLTIGTSADPDAGLIRVAVTDTGMGISSENLRQIFNPFFTTKSNGTGLGLSVSYGIVKEHGGRIDVESAPGAGSSFIVTLPR